MIEFSKKTDEELVVLARDGQQQARDELFHRYKGLVEACAHRYFLVGGETEDLQQEGLLGLFSAILDYDSNRAGACSFKNFAYLCILRKIFDAVKKASKTYAVLFPIDVCLLESEMGPDELLILKEEQREFRQKMSRELSDFEFKVTTMALDGMTLAEICEATGKPYKSVDNALQRSKKKLIKILKK